MLPVLNKINQFTDNIYMNSIDTLQNIDSTYKNHLKLNYKKIKYIKFKECCDNSISNSINELSTYDFNKFNSLKTLLLSHGSLPSNIGINNLNLYNLKTLNLNFNNISSINQFNNLPNLRRLKLSNNQIFKIDGLNNLSNLRHLDLSHQIIKHEFLLPELYLINKIENVNHLSNLRGLNLSQNAIQSIENVYNLPYLKFLDLSNNLIQSDLNFSLNLNNLSSNLNVLLLNGNLIQSISNVYWQNFKNLKKLDLSHNKIVEIPESFNCLTNLNELFLENCGFKNGYENSLNNLSNLNNLKLLVLSNNKIEVIGDLFDSSNNNLQLLDLSFNCIQSIDSPFKKLRNLKNLDLSYNKIKQITGFDNNNNLINLNLQNNFINHLDNLKNLTKLTRLNLMKNHLTCLNPLNCLINLQELNLQKNKISDINGMRLNNLTKIDLSRNLIRSVSLFDTQESFYFNFNNFNNYNKPKFSNLKSIRLNENKIEKISIKIDNNKFTNLEFIDLSHNRIKKENNLQVNIAVNNDIKSHLKIKLDGNQLSKYKIIPKNNVNNEVAPLPLFNGLVLGLS
ncbi:leucine-rich repeat domain-containing protein [Ascoidea rubescens DSM 1968]|uniref:L domain-like protein n=1 Tax=Ascoidea rubescens DSM 1968 TaxID=1344418 RepID=A0A1D2VS39_9ASCO|nr:L domain-like protein [Ascoidea rubescens DSM 1968]ODV64375.1 L domain-like protein [Ascoidea rubescens DSM 1968]